MTRTGTGVRKWPRLIILSVIAVIVAVGFVYVNGRAFDTDTKPRPLSNILRLPVSLPDSRHVSLDHMIRPGLPTVIALWASWCGPCRSEAPHLAELRRRYASDRLNFVYLNVRDSAATREDRTRFMIQNGMPADGYAVLADDRIHDLTDSSDTLVPRTIVFDRLGRGVGVITGYKPAALDRLYDIVGSR